jgi:broad specificity phosphatase PhoE
MPPSRSWPVESGAEANGGVELNAEMGARTAAVLRDVATAHAGQTIVVVSHGGFIHTAISTLALVPPEEIPHFGNCSISTLRLGADGMWRAEGIGETAAAAEAAACTNDQVNVDLPPHKF